jgi:translation initiation factor 5A
LQANITGLDIFTGQKKQDIAPTSHNMEAPFVHVDNLQLVDITDEGFCSLMTEAGETRDDLRLPDDNSPDKELGPRIRKAFEANKEVTCIITRAMDQEVVRRSTKGLCCDSQAWY